jgi:hypothetical protein
MEIVIILGFLAVALLSLFGLSYVVFKWRLYRLEKKLVSAPYLSIEHPDRFSILFNPSQRKNDIEMYWFEVKRVELTGKDTRLILHLMDNKLKELVKKDYKCWDDLIKAVPDSIEANDAFIEYRIRNFTNMACCQVCGKIAVKNGTCWHCGCSTFNHEFVKHSDSNVGPGVQIITGEKEYYTEKQLFWFDVEENGEVDFYATSILYENCSNWTPLVTEDEVREYWADTDEEVTTEQPESVGILARIKNTFFP